MRGLVHRASAAVFLAVFVLAPLPFGSTELSWVALWTLWALVAGFASHIVYGTDVAVVLFVLVFHLQRFGRRLADI